MEKSPHIYINDNVNLDFKATVKNKTTVSKTPE